eukprot:536354_1
MIKHKDSINSIYMKHLHIIIKLSEIKLNVNVNKVYLLGYSAGGDGVYRIGTRLANKFARISSNLNNTEYAHNKYELYLDFNVILSFLSMKYYHYYTYIWLWIYLENSVIFRRSISNWMGNYQIVQGMVKDIPHYFQFSITEF